MFEVTPEGEVVWEYINPMGRTADGGAVAYEIMADHVSDAYNTIFKCRRYAPDYPGLEGRDLRPKGLLTEIFPAATSRPSPAPPAGMGMGGG